MKRDFSGALARASLNIGVSLTALLIANPALAQDAGQVPDTQPTAEDTVQNPQGENVPEGATTETDDTTIVVTGTRIRQPEFTSPDPVQLIDPEVAQKEGKLDTATMLQSSPIAAGSTQITAALSSNFVTPGGPGAETLDLRGLGPNRTLVLLNGRRAGPAGTRGAVSSFDLNVLPQSVVSRVDILKTGASSIYGSDAIAGVVNLITKKDTQGLVVDANSSGPFDSGGEQYRIAATWGRDFGRGHVMAAVDYYKRQELARGDRSYLDCAEAYTFRESGERADLIDPRTGDFKCEDFRWGHVWTYDVEYLYGYRGSLHLANGGPYVGDVNLIQFQYPGETLGVPPAVFQPGDVSQFIAPPGWFPTGYDTASMAVQNAMHPFVSKQTLIPKTDRRTLYLDAAYELTDSIEVFGEFLRNRRETYQNGWRQFWNFGFTGNYYNPYYGFTVSDPTAAAAGFEGWNWLSATGITDQSDSSQTVKYTRGIAGLRGDFGGFLSNWSWDAHVQYSRSNGKYRTEQLLNDAVYEISYFQTTLCADTGGPWGPVTPISGKQCMDLPWYDPFFLRGEMTSEQIDYMFDWETGRTLYKQLNGEISATGKLFDLPAGP
ncbi:MAG TPA: TonB-dependent receptor plug domain-containing protein, partial [Acidimicrobiales bacterium]|nr:TonB-dependent receptor plug domain-containing protein [Acidimicrobiales bacterium]